MSIGEAKKLADRMGLTTAALLEASVGLYQDRRDADAKRFRKPAQLNHLDVALAS